MSNFENLIQQLQADLQAQAVPKTRDWWEKYMRDVIPFRGVGIPQIRDSVAAWRTAQDVNQWSHEAQLSLALRLFEEPIAEDKLAGILFLQNHLIDELPWQTLLPRFEEIFLKELIFDWNICDWFCVRVLGPMIIRHGDDCAAAIANWRDAGYLWQARASLVPFVKVYEEKRYHPLIRQCSETLIRREERFAKTAVGWVLRDVSKIDPAFVTGFVDKHLAYFSVESLKNALKYFDKPIVNKYLKTLKQSS